ncbi:MULTISPECIES: proline--tRNA ligase [Prochlorococcus]|uniref:proline--tRNA ligase n=1 Tax=Prochlorococcus TaxID=1218 RepID=UPI000533BC97|nr:MULTISPECIES: proline--tRNA ligase [Prochlorococcus]KGG12883.1 Prolyl-tRNA synthetase [Prochlorococcus sp. MIT 0601]
MRVSRLMLVTLRDVPADADIISHQLLLRGGFIKRATSGIYAYMPLMWKTLQKITRIIQEELNSKGCLEVLLPQLHPAELWKQTGRWQSYTQGEGIMFNLKDRQGRELGLGPTHEEIITKLVGETVNSYKQLPINLYQIQTKFRDEIRPRFGLMRSREFIMKDGYSFHSSEEDLQSTYEEMKDAYKNIFSRCGIETVPVEADSGAIGGAASQEYMVTADAGEDLILISSDGRYSANQEKAVSIPKQAKALETGKMSLIETKDKMTIDALCEGESFNSDQVIKVIVMLATLEDLEKQPILVSIRGDQELNEVKLINFISKHTQKNVLKISSISREDLKLQGLKDLPFGSIGPDLKDSFLSNSSGWEKQFIRVSDQTASELKSFVCGANELHKHKIFCTWELLGGTPQIADIRKAQPGDNCCHNRKEVLLEKRGIEVGHIFQLGRKYSLALEKGFTNEGGGLEPFWMGCYGIGVSRLAQASVEQNHDESGIIWPLSISPFDVIVVIANIQDEGQRNLGELIYNKLKENGIDVLIDDRKERAGVKFKDADLIGIPWRLVVGRDAPSGQVELFKRSNRNVSILNFEDAVKMLIEKIFKEKSP